MGDRVSCTLEFGGDFSADNMTLLREILDNEIATFSDGGVFKTAALSFDEINYGAMPEDLSNLLQEAGMSYIWMWGEGGGYPSGATAYTPERGMWSYSTSEWEPVIEVASIQKILAAGGTVDEIEALVQTSIPPTLPPFTVDGRKPPLDGNASEKELHAFFSLVPEPEPVDFLGAYWAATSVWAHETMRFAFRKLKSGSALYNKKTGLWSYFPPGRFDDHARENAMHCFEGDEMFPGEHAETFNRWAAQYF